MLRRLIAGLVCLGLIASYYQPVYAQDFSINQLPVPGTMVGESVPFNPLVLKGLVINPKQPLEFQFIVDTGRGPQDTASVQDQANQLVKYFLAALTIPEGDLWVNLSPYEKNRIVPVALGQTDLGRDLLAQDYILKQLTASLIYPERNLGHEFWSRVYAKAQKQFGTTNVPVNTFNKVWILPNQAQVFENGNGAYVTKSTLKVMLDEDYLAKQKHLSSPNVLVGEPDKVHALASQIVRAIILPEIEKEVNTGKNFAPLRQIYQALILAKWYKETIQNSLLDAIYTNKNKVDGVNVNDPSIKEKIYQRYLQAYKKGAFNYIKNEPTPDGQDMPRKYFSGGFIWTMILDHSGRIADISKKAMMSIIFALVPAKADEATSLQRRLDKRDWMIDAQGRIVKKPLNSREVNQRIRQAALERAYADHAMTGLEMVLVETMGLTVASWYSYPKPSLLIENPRYYDYSLINKNPDRARKILEKVPPSQLKNFKELWPFARGRRLLEKIKFLEIWHSPAMDGSQYFNPAIMDEVGNAYVKGRSISIEKKINRGLKEWSSIIIPKVTDHGIEREIQRTLKIYDETVYTVKIGRARIAIKSVKGAPSQQEVKTYPIGYARIPMVKEEAVAPVVSIKTKSDSKKRRTGARARGEGVLTNASSKSAKPRVKRNAAMLSFTPTETLLDMLIKAESVSDYKEYNAISNELNRRGVIAGNLLYKENANHQWVKVIRHSHSHGLAAMKIMVLKKTIRFNKGNIRLIANFLNSKDEEVIFLAIKTLDELADDPEVRPLFGSIVGRLFGLLLDRDLDVIQAGERLLIKLGATEQMNEVYLSALSSPSAAAQTNAYNQLRKKAVSNEQKVDMYMAALPSFYYVNHPSARIDAAKTLGEFGVGISRATDLVLGMLMDHDTDVLEAVNGAVKKLKPRTEQLLERYSLALKGVSTVRINAAKMLGDSDDPARAMELLNEALKQDGWWVSSQYFNGYGIIKASLIKLGATPLQRFNEYIEVLSSKYWIARLNAVRELGPLGEKLRVEAEKSRESGKIDEARELEVLIAGAIAPVLKLLNGSQKMNQAAEETLIKLGADKEQIVNTYIESLPPERAKNLLLALQQRTIFHQVAQDALRSLQSRFSSMPIPITPHAVTPKEALSYQTKMRINIQGYDTDSKELFNKPKSPELFAQEMNEAKRTNNAISPVFQGALLSDPRIEKIYEQIQGLVKEFGGNPTLEMKPDEIYITIADYSVPAGKGVAVTLDELTKMISEDAKGVKAFKIKLVGPHLMPNGAVIMEYTTDAPQLLHLRKLALARKNGFRIPDIVGGTICVVNNPNMSQKNLNNLRMSLDAYRDGIKKKGIEVTINRIRAVHFAQDMDQFIKSQDIQLGNPAQLSEVNGGIDLNQIKIKRTGNVINVKFDQAQLRELVQGDFEGFTPVIISMRPIKSPLSLLGIKAISPSVR